MTNSTHNAIEIRVRCPNEDCGREITMPLRECNPRADNIYGDGQLTIDVHCPHCDEAREYTQTIVIN